MISFSWLTTETRTLLAGGDETESLYDMLTFDGTANESYEGESLATEHPVEEGTDITDHIRAGNQRVTLEVLMSAHPGPAAQGQTTLGGFNPSESRVEAARAAIERLRRQGTIVAIDTPVGSWDSMVILSVVEAVEPSTGDGYRATIITREFRQVTTSEITAPSPRVERGRRRGDRGRQPGDGTDTDAVSSTPADRASALARIVDGATALAAGR